MHGLDGLARRALDGLDHPGDFLSGSGGAFGETSNLAGHNGKAAPLLTGARGFDGGVEGQQVGLAGNFGDDGGDGANLA